jgi:hypothetical protein
LLKNGAAFNNCSLRRARRFEVTEKRDYPNRKILKAVEKIIQDADPFVSRKNILKAMPAGTKRSTVDAALDYFEKRGWILDSKKGLIWIHNDNPWLMKSIAEGLRI